jgi:cysteine-rich repeat protein
MKFQMPFRHFAMLLSLALMAGIGCETPPAPSTGLPGGVDIAALSPEHRALLRVTLAISESALAETDLTLSSDFQSVSGTFDVQDVTSSKDATMTLRLYGRFSAESAEVVLGELKKPITLEPNVDVAIDFGSDDTFETCGAGRDGRCSLLFDSNRNGATNIADLLERTRSANGIDPAPQAPFLVTSPEQLQFPSGVRLGTFARQLVVLENFGQNPITISSATVVGGQGFAISILDPTGLSVEPPSRALNSDDFRTIAPGQEAFLAVSFAPVNSFVTTGALFVKVVDQVSLVEQTARVKLIANPEGELRPADPTYVEPDLSAINVSSGSVEVIAFPNAQLQSGDALIAEDAFGAGLRQTGNILDIGDGDDVIAFPADAAFAVDVRPGERFSTTLDGLESDIDVAVVGLNGNAIAGLACDTCLSRNAGLSPEAVEMRNDSGDTIRVLVLLGRVEAEPASTGVEGGLEAAETVGFRCASTVSIGPEFDAENPISPTTGPLEGGTAVTLRGSGFDPRARVFVGAAEALDVAIEATDDGIDIVTFTLPAAVGTENPASIIVENPADGGDGQAATLLESFTYQPPAPVIDEIRPDVAPTTGGTTDLTIIGRFFSARSGPPQITFGTVTVDATFVSASELAVRAPAHISENTAATVSVKVRNRLALDVGGAPVLGSASNGIAFRYVVPNDTAPVITALNPSEGSIDGATAVTLTGTGLRPGLEVFFNGREATCDVPASTTSVTCRTPAAVDPAVVDVILVNDDGQSTKLDVAFTYIIPPPTITSVFPARGNRDGGTLIVVEGGGFRPGARATFVQGGNTRPAAAATRVSGTTMLVTTPTADAGVADLVITNLDTQTVSTPFTFFAPEEATPPPSIASLSPSVGDASGGFPVVITGTGFLNPSVLFGSVQLSGQQVTFIDRNPPALDELQVLAPPSPTGVAAAVNVQVINDDGQSTSNAFNYTFTAAAAPRIDRVEPSTFNTNQQLSFTVTGARFDAGARILVGGILATISTRSSTSLRATVPGQGFQNAGTVLVVVENPNGDNVNAPISIVAPAPVVDPVVSAVSTRDVHASVAGDVITIFGSGFDQGPVTVTTSAPNQGSVSLSARVLQSTATSIAIELPALQPGPQTLTVRVETPSGPRTALTSVVAHDPLVVLAEGNDSLEVLIIGEFFNPAFLESVTFDDGAGVSVPCGQLVATERAITCRGISPTPGLRLTPTFTWVGSFAGVAQTPRVLTGEALGLPNEVVTRPLFLQGGVIAGRTDFAILPQVISVPFPGLDPGAFGQNLTVQLDVTPSPGAPPVTGVAVVTADELTITLNTGRLDDTSGSGASYRVIDGDVEVIFGFAEIVDRRAVVGGKAVTWGSPVAVSGFRLPGDEGRLLAQFAANSPLERPLDALVDGDELAVADTASLAPGAWFICYADQASNCAIDGTQIVINGLTQEREEGEKTGINANATIDGDVDAGDTDEFFFAFPGEGNTVFLSGACGEDMTATLLNEAGEPAADLCLAGAFFLPSGEFSVRFVGGPGIVDLVQYQLNVQGNGGAVRPVCGNGVPEEGEQCDDGNLENGDGCDDQCAVEGGELGQCGNSQLEPGEGCDEGDALNGALTSYRGTSQFVCDATCQDPDGANNVLVLQNAPNLARTLTVDDIDVFAFEVVQGGDVGIFTTLRNGLTPIAQCDQRITLTVRGDDGVAIIITNVGDGGCAFAPLNIPPGSYTAEVTATFPGDTFTYGIGAFASAPPQGVCGNGVVEADEDCDEGGDVGFCDAACNEPDEDQDVGGADIGAAPTLVQRTLIANDVDRIRFTASGEFRIRVVSRGGPCSTINEGRLNGVALGTSADGCIDDLVSLAGGESLIELFANGGPPLKYDVIIDDGIVAINPDPIDVNQNFTAFFGVPMDGNVLIVAQDIDGTVGEVRDAIPVNGFNGQGSGGVLSSGIAALCLSTAFPPQGNVPYAAMCQSPVFFASVGEGGGGDGCFEVNLEGGLPPDFGARQPGGSFGAPGYAPNGRVNALISRPLAGPVLIEAEITFDEPDLAFLSIRHDAFSFDGNNEPVNAITLRFHNDFGGNNTAELRGPSGELLDVVGIPGNAFGTPYRVVIEELGGDIQVLIENVQNSGTVTMNAPAPGGAGSQFAFTAETTRLTALLICESLP